MILGKFITFTLFFAISIIFVRLNPLASASCIRELQAKLAVLNYGDILQQRVSPPTLDLVEVLKDRSDLMRFLSDRGFFKMSVANRHLTLRRLPAHLFTEEIKTLQIILAKLKEAKKGGNTQKLGRLANKIKEFVDLIFSSPAEETFDYHRFAELLAEYQAYLGREGKIPYLTYAQDGVFPLATFSDLDVSQLNDLVSEGTWPVNYTFSEKYADGRKMTRAQFPIHDSDHISFYLHSKNRVGLTEWNPHPLHTALSEFRKTFKRELLIESLDPLERFLLENTYFTLIHEMHQFMNEFVLLDPSEARPRLLHLILRHWEASGTRVVAEVGHDFYGQNPIFVRNSSPNVLTAITQRQRRQVVQLIHKMLEEGQ